MPEVEQFLSGFGIEKGSYHAGYHLEDVTASHVPIVRYKKYTYHIILKYLINEKEMSISNFFNQHVFEDRTIYTSYGNPYRCHLQKFSYHIEGNYLLIELMGEAIRIR